MTVRTRPRVATVYDRVAGIYDLYTVPMEALGGRRARQRLLARATGEVLELGIGTGPELNRRTEDNIAAAGLQMTEVHRRGIWREIVATRRP